MAKLCVAPRDIEVIELGRISRLFAPNIYYDTCDDILGQRTVRPDVYDELTQTHDLTQAKHLLLQK
jgi:hypothetical protein